MDALVDSSVALPVNDREGSLGHGVPDRSPPIYAMPPELLDAVLTPLATDALVPLAVVNRLFHDVVARLLYRRLRRALSLLSLPNYQLVFECYHPSANTSTPYLRCAYLGTDGLDRGVNDDDDTPGSTLLRLPSMYSRFRPLPPEDGDVHVRGYRAVRRTMNYFMMAAAPAGTPVPSSDSNDASGSSSGEIDALPLVSCDVHLDESELFSQLCIATNLVKTGPRWSALSNCANIADGVVRVWRDWLAGKNAGLDKKVERVVPSAGADEAAVLWAYTGKHLGLQFRVTEKAAPDPPAPPVWAPASDEVPVSYELECEELLVRTYAFLRAAEEVEAQDDPHRGQAVVVVSVL